jgi:flavin reductase (DIM6/NTAB) family NADH-FMN oxidoreductase RutF
MSSAVGLLTLTHQGTNTMAAVLVTGQIQLDPAALRHAFGSFPTGVTVVTTLDADGRPRGMTANSFTSVSLDPALLLVCIGHGASSFPAFAECHSFAVNVLREDQEQVSMLFASKSALKFADVSYAARQTGCPVLTDCLTWFDCTVHQRIHAGDHTVLFGRVEQFDTSHAAPLGFSRGRYVKLKPR